MAEVINITVAGEWCKEDPDCTECFGCGEIMVTNTNGLYFFANNVLIDKKPCIKICNSCFDGVNTNK